MQRDSMPELLDDAGTVMRRVIQLPDRDEDMGAMLVRNLTWRVRERAGDGAATAAVLFQVIYNQGLTYITAGGNSMQLRRYLEQGMQVVLDELAAMTVPIEGKEQLAQVAWAICHDREMAKLLGEIFDIIGEYGRLEIRSGRSRVLEREYVEGMYWDTGLFSREMITDPLRLRVEMENVAILISDLDIEDPRELLPVLEMVLRADASTGLSTRIGSLLIIARKLADEAIGLLSANRKRTNLQVVGVKVPGMTTNDQVAFLEDMAVLTGGRALHQGAGQKLRNLKLEDLGRARRVWADRTFFSIVGGRGDPRALRKHLADLRTAFSQTRDADVRKNLRQRIGKLMGGAATLWVGGMSEVDINARKELAESTAEALRGAMLEGIVPGGGAALLACRPALRRRLDGSTDPDARAAYRILIRALEEPLRTIVDNAGCDVSRVMIDVELAGAGFGFDVEIEKVVNMREAGILDAANAQKAAVWSAVTNASMALTTDVLVHRKKPPEAIAP
jgi:chaperonin GroEL